MNVFMKTILNAIQSWTKKEIKNNTSDWNQNDVNQPGYVKNRTHYDSRKEEKITITFDGNLDGKEYIEFQGGDFVHYLVKVSDLTPSVEAWFGETYEFFTPEGIQSVKITDSENDTWGYDGENVYWIMDFNVYLEDFVTDQGTFIKGIWAYVEPDNFYPTKAAFSITTGELKKIDEKYLPEINISSKMDKNNPVGTGSFSMNRKAGTEIGAWSHAEGVETIASNDAAHAEGDSTTASGICSHAEGAGTIASSEAAHAEGVSTAASSLCSHAEGYKTEASGAYSHTEGNNTSTASNATAVVTNSTSKGYASHAEGYGSVATGAVSHAEGNGTKASGSCSHSEGRGTIANGNCSHAEGENTKVARNATAVTINNDVIGYCAHAEGYGSVASGPISHAEGNGTKASGTNSHTEGLGTTAQRKSQHAQGEYNILDAEGATITRGKYSHIVGNGTSDTARSNAHTLDWDGNAWYQGDVYVGSASGTNKDEGSKKLATEEFVSSKIAEAELGGEEVDLSGYALKSELPSRVSQLQNDSGYITGYTETDPTVPAWAKAASKPTYTASEVGADSKGTASSVVSAHNTATDAHNDIRLALKDINDRLNAFFDSDDKTLDELSEIVTYITSNKALIDSITTSKVSVSDIINNLTTNVSNKPLSAAQGVVLKGLIDTLNSGKLDASALSEAINTALAQAKASGEFDGAAGATGVGIKSITI